jgi:predicted nucleic acid-binding protein
VLAYLDTSAILPLFLTDRHTDAMRAWATEPTIVVVLSDFGAAEFVAAISRAVRIGRLSNAAATTVLTLFDRWRVQTEQRRIGGGDIAACERLLRDFRLKLNAPDALHLAIASTESVPLVTFDERLAVAARAIAHTTIVPAVPGK